MSKQSITKEILHKMEHEAEMAPTFRAWKEIDKVMNRRDWFDKMLLTIVFILMLLVGGYAVWFVVTRWHLLI